MNRQPKQGFNRELLQAVRDYHEWHRDTLIQVKKFVCNGMGEPLLLTRVRDETGKHMSVLLSFFWDCAYDRWDISEVISCPRKDEFTVVQERMEGITYE